MDHTYSARMASREEELSTAAALVSLSGKKEGAVLMHLPSVRVENHILQSHSEARKQLFRSLLTTEVQTHSVPPSPMLHSLLSKTNMRLNKNERKNPSAIGGRQQVKNNFPEKLFDILQNSQHDDVLRWLPGGDAFIIMNNHLFVSEILATYFKRCQFTSFTRKLIRWGFQRLSKRGVLMGAYSHKLFRRNNRNLCKIMSCKVNNDMETDERIMSAAKSASLGNRIMRDKRPVCSKNGFARPRVEATMQNNEVPYSSMRTQIRLFSKRRRYRQRIIQVLESQQRTLLNMTLNTNTRTTSNLFSQMNSIDQPNLQAERVIEAAYRVLDRGNAISNKASIIPRDFDASSPLLPMKATYNSYTCESMLIMASRHPIQKKPKVMKGKGDNGSLLPEIHFVNS